jgi:cell wall-associated NlpC family hydrolase
MTILLAALALLALSRRKTARDDSTPEDSTAEDYDVSSIETETMTDEPYADKLGDAIGSPYWWGKGAPSTPWSDIRKGADCSGSVQMALVRLGLLSATATDRSATQLAMDSDPVAIGEQRPGDMAFYNGHVMLVYSWPRSDGHSSVWGMHGGGSSTFGNDPTARLDVMRTAEYWKDGFLTYGRLRS